MTLPPALPSGTVIGSHYIVGDLINSGGFGAVYRAVDTSEGNRLCALKEIYNVTPAARRQALMEASVLFTVRSRHLPEVYDALEANGRFYLAMELIEGQNLLQILHRRVPPSLIGEQQPYQQAAGPCTEQEVLNWLLPIMDVLQELHSRSNPILHRDIKPGNIILRPDQTAVLVDFGLTRLYDPQRTTGTIARAVTEGFSPPEQYMGNTTPQSDIYSLAATMYLLLTNRLPPMALQRSVNDALIPPCQLNPTLSPKMEHALLRSLSVQTSLRYQSMRELSEALREPAFTGHADQTIAASIQMSGTQPALPPTPRQQALRLPAPPAQTTPVPVAPSLIQPASAYPSPARPSAGYQSISPGYVPQPSNYTPVPIGYAPVQQGYPYHQPGGYGGLPRPLGPPPVVAQPSQSSQGCLWGLVQGLLAGLLVAFTTEPSNFYLALLMGFFFYVVAGFMTTRKGGSALRGVWAGFWAGLISGVSFWIVYGFGYAILWVQQAQLLTQEHIRPDKIWERAKEAVHTALPPSQPSDLHSTFVTLLIICGGGLLLASFLGLMGGLFGNSRYKVWWNRKMERQQQQLQRQQQQYLQQQQRARP